MIQEDQSDSRPIKGMTGNVEYLDTVVPGVEESDASDIGQDGIFGVIQHVVGGHWREVVSLRTGVVSKKRQVRWAWHIATFPNQ